MKDKFRAKKNVIVLEFDETIYDNNIQDYSINIRLDSIIPANYFFSQLMLQVELFCTFDFAHNIQFRQLQTTGEFFAVTRDAEEVILAPAVEKESELISIVSNQSGYAKLYSQFIGPIFQANSRPIK